MKKKGPRDIGWNDDWHGIDEDPTKYRFELGERKEKEEEFEKAELPETNVGNWATNDLGDNDFLKEKIYLRQNDGGYF